MSTSVDFMEYIGGLLRDAPAVTWKKMFGEYGVYSQGKIFALVCDNQLFVKPTEAGRELLGEAELVPPYDGAKPYFLISELDDRDFLRELTERTCAELPEPKPKTRKKKGAAGQKGRVKKLVETDRLYLRRLTQDDFGDLCKILQDEKTMYAYEHAFSDQEVREWLDRQLARYEEYDFGLWAVILKETGELIGQCGITKQDCGGTIVPEIGYLFQRSFWRQGYAAEAAAACRKYGFEVLGLDELYSIIRPENEPSRRVAEKNGMEVRGQFTKRYYNMDMPHLIYSVKKPSWDKYDASRLPKMEEIDDYVANPLWTELRDYLEKRYQAKNAIEYSRCAEPGWNIKYKKAGRGLCTLYPKEGYFTALVVIGERERERAEAALPSFTEYLQELYLATRVGMGQRWLMIDVKSAEILEDVKELIALRRRPDPEQPAEL